ncbi:protein-glutamate O-methyltransferase CheR [Oscillospiraceae bacterium PP1C4]
MIKLTDEEFTALMTFVKKDYGINLMKKRVLIEGRLSNMLRERGLTSFQQYMDILFKDRTGTEVTNLLNKLTTNHSYFMRESEHFNYMVSHVLPYLEKNRPNHDLRIWSAGCSAGQEAYTMAMAIDEYFGMQKNLWDTTILATDISNNILDKAKLAIFAADNIKDIPESWRKKYFTPLSDGNYQVCDKIRKQVVFKPHNLMEPFSFKKPFDLIFCRNVMIYFDAQTKESLVNKFYDSTAVGGYLFIGHSEVINRETMKYTYIKPAIYQKRG